MIDIQPVLTELHLSPSSIGVSTGQHFFATSGQFLESHSPTDGKLIGKVEIASEDDYNKVIANATEAFKIWKTMPAPKRGEIVRQIGNKLRDYKHPLGQLVSYEMGKSLQEGLGEVQEMIDIADFAVGLSRQLYGLQITSERPEHRMMEQWHPLGIVGIITAFNFPVAVWSWNAILAAVCGNVSIWKPSEKTPITSIAVQNIIQSVLKENNIPEGVFSIVNGGSNVGQWLSHDHKVALVSATGSTLMGKKVGAVVAERMGKSLLELGGNNAIIVTPSANLEMALRAIVFGAVGTAGQRCTTTRRLILHSSVYETIKNKLVDIYKHIKVGHPLNQDNLVGPLIDTHAVGLYTKAIEMAIEQGGKLLFGNKVLSGEGYESGCYVLPTLIEAENHFPIVQSETFAPILYLLKYDGEVENAIAIQNDVKQGLSSSIFTNNIQEAEMFVSLSGSDCGIANVNIGTSGAEIGGAFGGEKETGGGRESGSDSWKAYMRRQTNTINYGKSLPLAQGIKFDI